MGGDLPCTGYWTVINVAYIAFVYHVYTCLESLHFFFLLLYIRNVNIHFHRPYSTYMEKKLFFATKFNFFFWLLIQPSAPHFCCRANNQNRDQLNMS